MIQSPGIERVKIHSVLHSNSQHVPVIFVPMTHCVLKQKASALLWANSIST